ncbi:trans-sulfuration enzyme family protein [Achromobacter aloeverae]|uniref:Cystathionine beta-lyase n=1 Tax=Achromobacter aloeverae TaxID=1750518 RepID=A0A4Q1HGE8_9BURK|nr:aminotransferase class I/II-fold pyridoxal phosphate-dependent enzyme [Achromobacter aloeverae]RXN86199.1 cystathionine beta-lyase [Achromobacter aloeverae]
MNEWTRCVVTPEVSHEGFASLAVPVYRASTIPFADAQAYATRRERGEEGYSYGLYGTPTSRTLERKITDLHGGVRTLLAPSGQAAIALAMLHLLEQGDHVLIPDTVYPPVRDFADQDLGRLGIAARYYDPTDLDALAAMIDDRTRLVWAESPGSTTMEVQDLSAIADLAHRRGALVGCDNTWASPLYFKPLRHGADIVVEALTKFFGGHSDVLMGSLTVKDPAIATRIRAGLGRMGVGVSPDDCSLVLRGMETMALRMDHSARVARALVERLQGHALVHRILYPALPGSPGHDLWKRDFSGASGVFSVVFTAAAAPHVGPALDVLKTFAIGASWGGTRSLAAPMPVRAVRSVRAWTDPDTVLRLSVGLEDEDDLAADIDLLLDYLERHCPSGGSA